MDTERHRPAQGRVTGATFATLASSGRIKPGRPIPFDEAGTEATARFIENLQTVPQEPLVPGTATKYDQAERAFYAGDEPDLDAIAVRVLVMNGEADPVTPPANARYIAERIGDNARLEIDPGTRHGWFIEHPDRFLELMTDFLG